mgnify:CR=1 FL=1
MAILPIADGMLLALLSLKSKIIKRAWEDQRLFCRNDAGFYVELMNITN